jgi:predicted alpha/beta hydrolase family esterase
MRKLIFIIFFFYTTNSLAEKLNLPDISENPIFTYKNSNAKVNFIGFVGGEGLKGNASKSQNPLARSAKDFRNSGSNYYVFPNPKKKKKIGDRKNKDHMSRISILIDHIKKENNLPIILLGHSRGSISVAAAANNLKKGKISGIVILGSITTPVGKYTPYTLTMKHMLKQTSIPVLVVHHEKDGCSVSSYMGAKNLAKKRNYKLISITGGGKSGSECGPLHYHGFEGTTDQVISSIQDWVKNF